MIKKRFLAILAALCVMTSMTSSAFAQGGEPNDPLYNDEYDYQWSLKQINMPKVWEKEKEYRGAGATICIIDSGLNLEHEDLAADYVKDTYNVFDGGKNVTDLLDGYEEWPETGMYVEVDGNMVLADDNTPDDAVRYNKKGHGTFVTGIISAVRNNGIGIAGIADQANIIVVKAFGEGKDTDTDTLIAALEYVVKNHPEVDVINMSLGTDKVVNDDEKEKFKKAIDAVVDKGMIVVAAVGNEGTSTVSYPAGFDNVIGVGGTDYNKVKCDFSQYNESVFVSAPGDHVVNKDLAIMTLYHIMDNDYCMPYGTSVAAPHVSGVAAIAKSIYPKLTTNQFKEILKKTSEDLTAVPSYFPEEFAEQMGDLTGYDTLYGYGLIDADKIITEVEKLANNEYDESNYRVLEYVKDEEGASVIVETDDLNASVYIVSYKDNALSSVRCVNIGDLESEMDDNGNYCRYTIPLSEGDPEPSKLLLWHDMTSCKTWESEPEAPTE